MAAKKSKKGAKPLTVRESLSVRFGGPVDLEQSARDAFEGHIATWLRLACPRFAKTRQPEIQAARIVRGIPYTPTSRPTLDVRKLNVDYQNNRASGAHGRWKVWVRVANWHDTAAGQAGAFASSFAGSEEPKKKSGTKTSVKPKTKKK